MISDNCRLPSLAPWQESRKRKKRRLEELQRSVLFLTHENHQLREQNELLRQMLVGRLPGAPLAGSISNPVATAVASQEPQPTDQVGAEGLGGPKRGTDREGRGVGSRHEHVDSIG